jgi:hypothetical protein
MAMPVFDAGGRELAPAQVLERPVGPHAGNVNAAAELLERRRREAVENRWITRRGADVRAALAGEVPVRSFTFPAPAIDAPVLEELAALSIDARRI